MFSQYQARLAISNKVGWCNPNMEKVPTQRDSIYKFIALCTHFITKDFNLIF